jgi:hypothetical protein
MAPSAKDIPEVVKLVPDDVSALLESPAGQLAQVHNPNLARRLIVDYMGWSLKHGTITSPESSSQTLRGNQREEKR